MISKKETVSNVDGIVLTYNAAQLVPFFQAQNAAQPAPFLQAQNVYNGTESPYVDPPAPVHVVTEGCQENTDTFIEHPLPWSAFQSSNYDFSRMQIFNATHLYFEQTTAAKNLTEDSFWLIKHEHKPYTKENLRKLNEFGTYIPYDYCHHPNHCNTRVNRGHI